MELSGFNRQINNGIIYFTISSFTETGLVVHGFSGRQGGVSPDRFASLNLSIHTEDKLKNVLENRTRFVKVLGLSLDNLVGAHQIHGDRVFKVTASDQGRGSRDGCNVIPDTDALMTDEKGLALIAFFADCVPVFFLDPEHKAIALAHAGWKGTVAKIVTKTVQAMQEAYGTDPARLLAAVGPSIGPCHYEVDDLVINKVKEAFPGYENELLSCQGNPGHANFNLWQANVIQLKMLGIPEENITVAGLCTYCEQGLFFSHRAGMAGRQAALLMLK